MELEDILFAILAFVVLLAVLSSGYYDEED